MKILKMLLGYLLCSLICFLLIWLTVLCGGWKLFESGDPLLMEIGIAQIAGILVYGIYFAIQALLKQIKDLELRVAQLEKNKKA